MSKSIPYLFCKYQIEAKDEALSGDEQFELFKEIRGKLIAYRVADPGPDDETTFLMRPREHVIQKHTVLTWDVADEMRTRGKTRYDPKSDDVIDEQEVTDEIRLTKFVAIPNLGAMAIEDRVSDRTLVARSAASRFISLCDHWASAKVNLVYAGTPQDVQRALDTWELERFLFTVRPFNPTPRKPGDKLDELLKNDHVGIMRGVATPSGAHSMRDSHEGLISETKGLTDEGYGQIGAMGTTPNGFKASLSKPKFEMDKNKNKQRQAENRTLRVYIPCDGSTQDELGSVVKALLEMYG